MAPLTLVEHRRDTSANCLWSRRCRRLEHSSRRRYRSSPREGRRRRGKRLKRCRGRPLQLTHSADPSQSRRRRSRRSGALAVPACLPRVALGGGVPSGRQGDGGARDRAEPAASRDRFLVRAGGWMDGLVSWRAAQERQKRRQKEEGNQGEKNCSRATWAVFSCEICSVKFTVVTL